ncbi:MAG: sulfocyanin-like copper-binding protein [Gemmatimonadaceae bacterium]
MRYGVRVLAIGLILGGCAGPDSEDKGAIGDSAAAAASTDAQTMSPADTQRVPQPTQDDKADTSADRSSRSRNAATRTPSPDTVTGKPAAPIQPGRTAAPPAAATKPPAAAEPAPAPSSEGQDGKARVNQFLSYDASKKTAYLELIGGFNGVNGALNFNGGAKGNHNVTIPLGWRVATTFVNKDGDLPHSAAVINDVSPMPLTSPGPAFPRAFTVKLEEGVQESGSDDMSFTATKEGRFLIFCGVPGHAQGGMWTYLTVSAAAPVPTYQP